MSMGLSLVHLRNPFNKFLFMMYVFGLYNLGCFNLNKIKKITNRNKYAFPQGTQLCFLSLPHPQNKIVATVAVRMD